LQPVLNSQKKPNPEKKLKLKIALLFLLAFLWGCATVPVGKDILLFDIQPDKNIKPGTIVVATVKTTDDIKEVYGSIEVPGSPRIPLKYDSEKKEWYFKYMIPLTIAIPKGDFIAKVEAISKSGSKSFAEKKVSTY